jgi:sec-independent protein translocase protein TatC
LKAAPILEHLKELRCGFIVIIIYFLLFLVLGVAISPLLVKKIINDLLIANVELVSLSPLEFLYTQIKVGFIFALTLTSPIIIYQLIKFIKPGMKKKEIRLIKYTLPVFILLLIFGISFAYLIFLKVSLFFLANLSSIADIQNLWSINKFISFIVGMSLALGFVFEVPLLLFLLKKLNIVNIKSLKKYRAHVYVFAFIIAAIISPPDVVTQILIALPLIGLFELSYFLAKVFG